MEGRGEDVECAVALKSTLVTWQIVPVANLRGRPRSRLCY
jgi:hypothetical protein